MKTMTDFRQLISELEELRDDHLIVFNMEKSKKTFSLSGGYSLSIEIENDELLSSWRNLSDFIPGQLSDWCSSYDCRPTGFTGAAVKIARDGRYCVWWEPDRDGREVYHNSRKYVERVLKDGFCYVSVGLLGTAVDDFGNEHTVEILGESICGIDWPHVVNSYEPVDSAVSELIDSMISCIGISANRPLVASA